MAFEKIEFVGPIFLTKESKFEDVNEILANHNIANSYDDWLLTNQEYVKEYLKYGGEALGEVEEQKICDFVIENNISSFMVEPVAIYNGQTLTAATKKMTDLADPFFTKLREDGAEIVLYRLYAFAESTSFKYYTVKYATYNGV